ncbi:VOC family protein [Pseudonocardia sp. C8]|uniref:VOC family protein n=1 Tax=Pseudonocardia sp. C8 TaxID=2762759 RepID=UPI0016429D32|nr:VOC family protein [Pseudonocardia sp. C8]MBC3190093.1 VOC family protein [Pseudonocardia sp. C8]
MIKYPRFVTIWVSDQEKARDFFTETLGCELLTDVPYSGEDRWIEVRWPGAQTRLVLARADTELRAVLRERVGAMSHVWFECDDLDATYAQLTANGVEFPVPPGPAPWEPDRTRWAQFADPDGNLYGMSEQAG